MSNYLLLLYLAAFILVALVIALVIVLLLNAHMSYIRKKLDLYRPKHIRGDIYDRL